MSSRNSGTVRFGSKSTPVVSNRTRPAQATILGEDEVKTSHVWADHGVARDKLLDLRLVDLQSFAVRFGRRDDQAPVELRSTRELVCQLTVRLWPVNVGSAKW
jgi:hypothetical protein